MSLISRVRHLFSATGADNDDAPPGVVQPSHWNADHDLELSPSLAAIDPLAPAANRIIYFDDNAAAGLTILSAFVRAILTMNTGADVLGAIGGVGALNAALTGVPTAPNAAAGTNTTQIANTAFVQAAIAALINSAPGALDTLKELADALGDDANFATTVTNALAGKQASSTNLTALAGLVGAANKVPYFTAAGVMALLVVGTAANNLVQLDGSAKLPAVDGSQLTNLPGATAATQADQETATSTSKFVSPGTQKFHPGAAKAWAAFDKNGTVLASYGVSSVTRKGAGWYQVAFTTPFSSANYCAVSCTGGDANSGTGTGTGGAGCTSMQPRNQLAGSCDFVCFNTVSANLDDSGNNFVAFYGDQ